jgi:glycosyltransferase involved in cell wall biosynthesis
MRILQIHNRYREPGGEDAVVAAEAALLRAAGHQVHQFQVENPVGALAAAASLTASPWNPLAAKRLRDVVMSFGPHVAHVHNTWFSLTSSVLASLQRLRVPVVVTLHNYRFMCANGLLFRDGAPCELCVGHHPWNAVRYRCYRDSAPASAMAAAAITINSQRGSWERNVDLFLALTEFARGRFIAAGLPEARIRVKPNFVDDPGPRPRPPSASTTVLYVGRIGSEKGLEVALRAWASTPNDLELLVIGDGPQRAELEKGAWGRVRFLGRLPPDETRRHMLGARALLFPSLWYEGLPMVLLEAFAAGLPVVGSDLGSTAEVLSPTSDWRVVPGDAVAWEQALGRLAATERFDAAGRDVRTEYEARYTPDEGLNLLEDAYEAVRRQEPGA